MLVKAQRLVLETSPTILISHSHTWFHHSDKLWETVFFNMGIYEYPMACDGIIAVCKMK